jgi:hypothetical protein
VRWFDWLVVATLLPVYAWVWRSGLVQATLDDLPRRLDDWVSRFRELHGMAPDWEVERRRARRDVCVGARR